MFAHAMKPCVANGDPYEFFVWRLVFPFYVAFESGFEPFSCHFGEVFFHHDHLVAVAIVVSPCGGNGTVGYLFFYLTHFFYVVGYSDIRNADDIAVML